MRSLLSALYCCMLTAASPAALPAARAQELTSATFASETGNDDKDHDTGVYVVVYDAARKKLLAAAQNAEHCPGESCHYNDYSRHEFALKVTPGVTKAQCLDFVVVLASQARGNDNWEIRKASVTLKFSDGSTLQKPVYNVSLNSRGSRMVSIQF